MNILLNECAVTHVHGLLQILKTSLIHEHFIIRMCSVLETVVIPHA